MHDWPPRREGSKEKASSEPLILAAGRECSREGSVSGYEALLASEEGLFPRRHHFRLCSASSVVIGVLLALLAVETYFFSRAFEPPRIWPVPNFVTHEMSLHRQLDWEFGPDAHSLWAGVIPDSGLVAIEKPEQYGLNDGLETSAPDSQVYGVVVTHEYHCLRMIRESFFGLVTREERYMDELFAANASVQLPAGKLNHIFHCIDYLRQMILCRSDTTLEWQSDISSKHIDGYGPPHQCRSWDEVRSWMAASLPPESEYLHQLVT